MKDKIEKAVELVIEEVEFQEEGFSSFEASRYYSKIIERLEAMRDGAESANEWQ